MLWDGYNAFYGRSGLTALDESITAQTWYRFFQESDPVRAFVAELHGSIAGFVHYVYHPSTTRLRDVCYLQDLFTREAVRGHGVGAALIRAVYDAARQSKCSRVYWTTQVANSPARALYYKLATHAGFIVYSKEV